MEEPLDLSIHGAAFNLPPKRIVKRVARRLEFPREIKIFSPKTLGPDDSDPLIALSPLLDTSDFSNGDSSMADVFHYEDQEMESDENVPLDLTMAKSDANDEPCLQHIDCQPLYSMIQHPQFAQNPSQESPGVSQRGFISKLSHSYQLYQWQKQQAPRTNEENPEIFYKYSNRENISDGICESERNVTFINQTNIPTLEVNYIFSLNFKNCDGSEIVDVSGETFRVEAEAPVTCNLYGFVRSGRCIVVRNANGFLEQFLLLEKTPLQRGPATDTLLYSISTRYVRLSEYRNRMKAVNMERTFAVPDTQKADEIRYIRSENYFKIKVFTSNYHFNRAIRTAKNDAILNLLNSTKVKLDLTRLNNPDFEYCFGKSEWTIRFLESWKLRIVIKMGNLFNDNLKVTINKYSEFIIL